MAEPRRRIVLRDSTLREALDTPGVAFSTEQRLTIARALEALGVREAEVVAPARVGTDLEIAARLQNEGLHLELAGLVYANRPSCDAEVARAARILDRIDLIMPLSRHREPNDVGRKGTMLAAAIERSQGAGAAIGAGLPHASQVDIGVVVQMACRAEAAGAARIIVYDTNGSAEPFGVRDLVAAVHEAVAVPVYFHGHNDLGLAVANAWAAVAAGAAGIDVTLTGLGDRAGNASLEQLAVLLHLHQIETGIEIARLAQACRLVEETSGIPVSRLAPVIGEYAFDHRSPTHLAVPVEFEAFDPALVGSARLTGES